MVMPALSRLSAGSAASRAANSFFVAAVSRGTARIRLRWATARLAATARLSELWSNRRCTSISTRAIAATSDVPRRERSSAKPATATPMATASPAGTIFRAKDTVSPRIHGCYSEIDLDLRLLLKRGALLAAANWPVLVIEFITDVTFQVLLAVPIIGAAILVAV